MMMNTKLFKAEKLQNLSSRVNLSNCTTKSKIQWSSVVNKDIQPANLYSQIAELLQNARKNVHKNCLIILN
jgi:hypothetical protein